MGNKCVEKNQLLLQLGPIKWLIGLNHCCIKTMSLYTAV
jgi:hypothetical protein